MQKLRQLYPLKECSPDVLLTHIYRHLADDIGQMLCFIFQQIYDEIPDDWKEALVTSIHKKGSTSNAVNCRPIY